MLCAIALAFVTQMVLLAAQPNPQNCAELVGEKWMKPEKDKPFFFHTEFCYLFVNKPKMNCSKAIDYCADIQRVIGGTSVHARLVEIYSEVKNNWISGKIHGSGGGRWIGLIYNYATHEFEWDSGHQVEYENWGTNQPDNQTFDNCVVININDGTWNDQPGHKPRKIICEIQVLRSECASTHDIVADVADDKLTASSVFVPGSGPQRARLGTVDDTEGYNAWVPHMLTDNDPYIQVEFDNVKRVIGIVTKGSNRFHSWLEKYLVDYSTDGADWTRITENNVEETD